MLTWEALLIDPDNGEERVLREANGDQYGTIPRRVLKTFSLVDQAGNHVVDLESQEEQGMYGLCWRRRTHVTEGKKFSFHVLGYVGTPSTVALAVGEDGEILAKLDQFYPTHPLLYPPSPRPHEGEYFLI